MFKIKNFFFALLLFSVFFSFNEIKAQEYETVFAVGDTAQSYGIPSDVDQMFVTAVDSSMTGTDSLVILVKSAGVVTAASVLSARRISSTSLTTFNDTLIAGNGITATWEADLEHSPYGTIEVKRVNNLTAANTPYTPRTRIFIQFKKRKR